MNILLDIGNSRLKWVIENQAQINQVLAVDYRQPEFLDSLRQGWQAIGVPQKVAIASVANKQVFNSILLLSQNLWPGCQVIIPQSSRLAFGVKNAYEYPEKLGVDRWLAMIAAHHHYAGNVCVVDCGTAVTIDAVQADGRHLGGLICPGLNMMKQALASNAADLSFSHWHYRSELATATDDAIANGVFLAVTGLIEKTLQKLDASYQLVLTGGDAELIAESFAMPCVLDQNLVLKGLSIFCQSGLQL